MRLRMIGAKELSHGPVKPYGHDVIIPPNDAERNMNRLETHSKEEGNRWIRAKVKLTRKRASKQCL